jgi:hypothetical protein
MKLAEVTAILGPSGDRTTMELECDLSAGQEGDILCVPDPQIASTALWSTDTAAVVVGFDRTGNVGIASFYPLRPSSETTWSKVRNRAEALWREWFP